MNSVKRGAGGGACDFHIFLSFRVCGFAPPAPHFPAHAGLPAPVAPARWVISRSMDIVPFLAVDVYWRFAQCFALVFVQFAVYLYNGKFRRLLCIKVMYMCCVCVLCMYVMYVCYVCVLCVFRPPAIPTVPTNSSPPPLPGGTTNTIAAHSTFARAARRNTYIGAWANFARWENRI